MPYTKQTRALDQIFVISDVFSSKYALSTDIHFCAAECGPFARSTQAQTHHWVAMVAAKYHFIAISRLDGGKQRVDKAKTSNKI